MTGEAPEMSGGVLAAVLAGVAGSSVAALAVDGTRGPLGSRVNVEGEPPALARMHNDPREDSARPSGP
jgi:hypothetical protein